MAFAQAARPIPGAVATLGVSDRVDFLRKTYGLLGAALIGFALVAGLLLKTTFSWTFSVWALSGNGGFNWMIVLGLFMVIGIVAQKLAQSETSRGLQFAGLGIAVVAQGILLQPLLQIAIARFGTGDAQNIIMQAVVITLAIFIGLTLTVFITRKDFSFMRGILTMCTFAAMGVIIASLIFGFSLGGLFCGLMILLMGGYILFQTSAVMRDFPPTAFVAAALMLFSTIATLFWYVLQLLMSRRN